MKAERKMLKCAVCNRESEQMLYMSDFIRGYPDFDGKPVGSRLGVGGNIMECPYCHYANYNITETIESRLFNNLDLWNSSFQSIINNYSGPLRKILLVAKQYENHMKYKEAYRTYTLASWASETEEQEKEFRCKALDIFFKKVIQNYRDDLLQITDMVRMEGKFDLALELNEVVDKITYKSEEKVLKTIDAEKNLIENKDSKRHNLKEVFE